MEPSEYDYFIRVVVAVAEAQGLITATLNHYISEGEIVQELRAKGLN